MQWYSTEPRTRKYVKEYGFLSFARKYKKQLFDTGLNVSKKVVHKAGGIYGIKLWRLQLSQTRTILWNENLLKKWLFHQKKEKKY